MPQSATRGPGTAATASFEECIPDARRALRSERDILRTEADAFGRFCRRVQSVDADPEPTDSAPGQSAATVTLAARTEHAASAAIREAYVETVMDTPHYAAEYGDTYWESVASEFGAELAMALRQAACVTPLLRDQVLAAARESKRSRKQLLADLDDEADALDAAERTLRAVHEDLVAIRSRPFYGCPPHELRQLLADLDALEADCQDLAVRRQTGDLEPKTVHVPSADARPLNEYLYQSIGSSHPLLSAVGRASDDVVTTARRIRQVLAAETGE
ncbi:MULTISPECIES: hypothetical protein [Halobacterium]|uniref:DUF7260 family protein n=1 Tax=Halobacterium TaxID=2239 RepID=UPI00073F83EF|nr:MULTISPECIES: hypothetical protein [Halobacterium]MCG1002094.1 hypothetical protein [Halobacterium noricense]